MQDNTIQNRTNPFFVPYNTPHDTVPFERIRLEDYEPAFMEGIRRDDEATDKIVNDPAEPTFENTIARVLRIPPKSRKKKAGSLHSIIQVILHL